MKTENVIQEKSFAFAIRIVKLYKYLTEEKKEFILSKQLLRSGTSIGANIEESIGGQSEKDFYYQTFNFVQRNTRNNVLAKIAECNRFFER